MSATTLHRERWLKSRTLRSIGAALPLVTLVLVGALMLLLANVAAFAQERPIANLKDLPLDQQVSAVSYCRGEYEVSLGDSSARRFKEYDLAFKTDSSPNGPNPTKPALVPTGRVGDRAFVIFANLQEL